MANKENKPGIDYATQERELNVRYWVATAACIVLVVVLIGVIANNFAQVNHYKALTAAAKDRYEQEVAKQDTLVKETKNITKVIDKTHDSRVDDPTYEKVVVGLTDMFSWKDDVEFEKHANEVIHVFKGAFVDDFIGTPSITKGAVKDSNTHRVLKSLTVTRFENDDFFAQINSASAFNGKDDNDAIGKDYFLRIHPLGDGTFSVTDMGKIGNLAG